MERYLTWFLTPLESAKIWCLWTHWNGNQVKSDESEFHGRSSKWQE